MILLNYDLDNAENAIKALDSAGISPSVAMWTKLPDYEDWRLVIASDKLDQDSPKAGYEVVVEALRAAEVPIQMRTSVVLLPMRSTFVQAIRRIFANAAGVYGMRLGGQTIGDKYIEEAFVYRVQ